MIIVYPRILHADTSYCVSAILFAMINAAFVELLEQILVLEEFVWAQPILCESVLPISPNPPDHAGTKSEIILESN